jgi:predicted DNA-binding protein
MLHIIRGIYLGRKISVSASLDLEDIERLEDLSRQADKSISELIRLAVKEFLEKKLKSVEEAKA